MRNVRMTIWVIVASLCLINSMTLADCPLPDLTGNCKVDLADFAIMASEWLEEGTLAGVTFGKLVVERTYRVNDKIFKGLVQKWLDGGGQTKDAELMYRNAADTDVRKVSFLGLRPTSYYTIARGFMDQFGDYSESIVEHVEFSVEHVDIENMGDGSNTFSRNCVFEFGGERMDFLSVKPPEIYFRVQVQRPQSFGNFHVNAGTILGHHKIVVTSNGPREDNLWSRVEGGSVDIKYVQGNASEAKGEDVTLNGPLFGNSERDWLVDWMNSWIVSLEPPQHISLSYYDYRNTLYYQGSFIDATPTSYILPTVDRSSEELLLESVSFTYVGTTEN